MTYNVIVARYTLIEDATRPLIILYTSQNRERAETQYAGKNSVSGQILVFALIFARCSVLLYKPENALSGRITV